MSNFSTFIIALHGRSTLHLIELCASPAQWRQRPLMKEFEAMNSAISISAISLNFPPFRVIRVPIFLFQSALQLSFIKFSISWACEEFWFSNLTCSSSSSCPSFFLFLFFYFLPTLLFIFKFAPRLLFFFYFLPPFIFSTNQKISNIIHSISIFFSNFQPIAMLHSLFSLFPLIINK